MNRYSFLQTSFLACEEMKSATVVCPRPQRLSLLDATDYEPLCMRPLRRQHVSQQYPCDAKVGNELLDIIPSKGAYVDHSATKVALPPPFFSGSPPSRLANPLIQDSRFGDEKFTPLSPQAIPVPAGLAPTPSLAHKVGCTHTNHSSNPSIRVEGFDCLDRDKRRHGIPALA